MTKEELKQVQRYLKKQQTYRLIMKRETPTYKQDRIIMKLYVDYLRHQRQIKKLLQIDEQDKDIEDLLMGENDE